jgi:hypothetical protein
LADEPTTAITTDEGGHDLTDLALVKAALLDGTLELEVDPARMAAAIVERILEQPVEDVYKAEVVMHAKDLLGRPFKPRSVRWFPSNFDEGPSVYAAVDAVLLDTGELAIVTVGATRGMAQLLRSQIAGKFPEAVRVVEATRPTASGFYPYWLEEVEVATPEGA